MESLSAVEHSHVDLLHEIGSRLAASSPLHDVLASVVEFASVLVEYLVLRASKQPHPDVVDRLKLRVGQGITGWVAEHLEPVALSHDASKDPRFRMLNELPEDSYEAFLSVPLLSRGRMVGVINLQHRRAHLYTQRQIRLISTIGFLVGAEIELARLEEANLNLSEKLQTRKIVERAKGILQVELGLTEEQAYLALQRQSRQKRMSMKDVARAIILSDEVKGSSRTA
jgi:uroporphyrinogen-III synthase